MDEDVALASTADDNTGLAPEVRAELQSLAQDARETISRAWSPHTHRAYAGAWSRFVEWTSARGLQTLPAEPGQTHPAVVAGNSPVYSHGCKPSLPVAEGAAGNPSCRTFGRILYFRYSSQG